MNLFVKIVLLACMLVVTAKPLTEEEKNAMYKDIIANCKVQEGASDLDIQELMAHTPPSSRSGQCLNACVMESIGMMKDGKLSVEGSIKMAETSGDPQKVKNAETIGKQCQSVGGGDRCESVMIIIECAAKAAAELGIHHIKDTS